MRTLTFTPGSDAYRLLHEATLLSQMQLTPQQYRLTAKVQDRLEAIGQPVSSTVEPKLGAVIVYATPSGGAVTFEETEFAHLKALLESFPATKTVAKQMAGLFDLLDATKEETPTPKDSV